MKINGWIVSLRSLISLRWEKRIPKLILHEKFQKIVNIFTLVLIMIGILSALFTFPSKCWALIFSIFWYFLMRFVQKTIFEYTTIFIQPWPEFDLYPGEWLGMGFASPGGNQPKQLNMVGCAFKRDDFARDFFNLLRKWNFDSDDDGENNIRLSFVIENDDKYTVYIYPSPERKVIEQIFKDSENIRGKEYYQKEHQKLIMQITFYNTFPYQQSSFLRKFINEQPMGKPFWFQAFHYLDNQNIEINFDVPPILKYHYLVKHRDDLKKGDYEYELKRFLDKY